nr:hypothetical protein [Tanacetum cinerariifolium]
MTVMDHTGEAVVTPTAATTTTLATTTGVLVMGVTRETGVSSPTDLSILISSSPGVPLRATPTRSALRVDADTQESVVELLVPASSVVKLAICRRIARRTPLQVHLVRLIRSQVHRVAFLPSLRIMILRPHVSSPVANAARNYEILHERDDDDTERPDKRRRHLGECRQAAGSSGLQRSFRCAMLIYSFSLCYSLSLYPFTERYAQPYFFSCLIRQIRVEIREEFRTSSGPSDSGGNPPPVTIYTWLKRFNKQNPCSFEKATAPVDAENWISHMEKIFDVMGCEDAFKTRLAVYKFEGNALAWWKAYKQAKGAVEREYHSIRQTNTETSTEFMQRFLRLAGFLGAVAGTEEEQEKNFQWGLHKSTLNHLMCMPFTDVAQVANAARNYEILHERDDDDAERPDKR